MPAIQKEHLEEAIAICRREVDNELKEIHDLIKTHIFTEEQVEHIATRAAEKAKVMAKGEIKQEMIDDVKMEIADSAIEIIKRAAQAVALTIIGLAFYLGSIKWPWK